MPERERVETKKSKGTGFVSVIQNNSVAVAIIVTVLMMFIPLPQIIIDIAMSLNLAVALITLLTVIYTRRAADFTSFPRVTLLVTLYGLAINIASTRLILTHPVSSGVDVGNLPGQSWLVQAFGNIVTGGNIVVGFIVFIILIVVQVLVVTKGADRVSEVSARFTLDAMNNKMFDIQNEFNAGTISEEEATRRKEQIRREVDFYSAMDGASKFVSGNVKAGIFITVVNLIGGIITGMIVGQVTMGEAFKSYATLTIGDGLMSQLPALMLSFGTGILVTGSSADELIGDQLKRNFAVSGMVYVIVGIALLAMGVAFFGPATFVLVPVGILFVYLGFRMQKMQKAKELKAEADAKAEKSKKQTGSSPDEVSPIVALDPLALDLGYALVPLVDREKGAELLERVTRIRREEALELGLVVPPIRIRDSMSIDPEEYSFKIRGIEVGKSRLKLGYYMCLNTGSVKKENLMSGEKTSDPAFGMEAIWLPESKRAEAERVGYMVIDPPTIIATHLTEIIRSHAADILSRQEVASIINKIKDTNPVVVDEILTGEHKFTYGEIETVLKGLLDEQVSIRNMVVILETLANYAPLTKDPWFLMEKVRQALGAQICLQYVDENKVLPVLMLSQSLAQSLFEKKIERPGQKPIVGFDPVDNRKFLEAVSASVAAVRDRSFLPIILCPDEVRLLMHSAIEREMDRVAVLSLSEVMSAGNSIHVETLGEINVQ
ncbi:MAG: FHIPEP family type III secretion protein [Treponema sp.]|nr:FHIPEP family type III secretion protein [Treponema sp.]MBR4005628.1 FHIPEP family type III secretion protein [Treponema sp.]